MSMNLEDHIRDIVRKEVAEAIAKLTAQDELVRLPGPLERETCRRLVKSGALKATKRGRSYYARKSDVIAAVEGVAKATAPLPTGSPSTIDVKAYAEAVARKRSA